MGARNIITVLGAAVGASFGYPQLGFVVGSLVGNAVDPVQIEGARLEDLKATGYEYGTPIAQVYGTPRVPGIVAWASDKQEQAQTSGGKGGPETTSYTYTQDVLYLLSANEIAGVRRIWANGKLVWNASDDATDSTIAASVDTPMWTALEVFSGASDQLPWSVYEAAVGVGNAPAMRGRGCVGITGLSLGSSGYAPQLTFEIVTAGTVEDAQTDGIRTIFPWSMVARDGDACVVSAMPVHGDCKNGDLLISAYAIYDYNPPEGYFDSVAECLAAIVAAAALPNPISGGFAAGQTYVGYVTSVNNLPSYFDGGATLAGDPEFIYLLFATGPIDAINNATTGTLCDAMIAAGIDADDGKVFVSRHDADAQVFRTFKMKRETSALPSGYIDSAGACTAYGDGGDGFFPSMVLAPLSIIAIKRVLSCEPTCTEVTYSVGEARQLIIGETYGPPPDLGIGLGGVLDQVPSGPILLSSDPNFNNEDWWRAQALEAGVDLTGRTFMSSPTDDGGVPSAPVTTRFGAFTTIGCACDAGIAQVTVGDVTLSSVVEDLCVRSGLEASYLDVTDLDAQNVRALAITQISTARQVIEMLMGAYFFTAVEGHNLKFVARGAAPVDTIEPRVLGAALSGSIDAAADPVPITRAGDAEIPAQFAVTYANATADYQQATEYSDRLVPSATGVAASQIPLALTPQEAKRIADVNLLDAILRATTIGPLQATVDLIAIEPADVLMVEDESGNEYRVRVERVTDTGLLRNIDCVLDDASALSSAALTDESYTGSSVVLALSATALVLGDWPIFRDADNDAGHYAAFAPASEGGTWPGAALFRGISGTAYVEQLRTTDRTAIGASTTALGDWTGGAVFDEVNSVTVYVGTTLDNYTRAQILEGTAPLYMVGAEAIYARTATLVSAGVYTLSGLLRGRRGTEWAIGEHAVGDRVVLISPTGVRRAEMENGQLGVQFSFKAPTFGRSVAGATGAEFTNSGVGLKPFAPVDIRLARDTDSDDLTVSWKRRTRLSCRFTGTAGINVPVGESPEAYEVDIYSATSDPLLLRTLASSTQSAVYSAADQATDSVTPGDSLTFVVYQLSAVVGRGYPHSETLATPPSLVP